MKSSGLKSVKHTYDEKTGKTRKLAHGEIQTPKLVSARGDFIETKNGRMVESKGAAGWSKESGHAYSSHASAEYSVDALETMLQTAVPMNEAQIIDVVNMSVDSPALVGGLGATKGWAFCHPPSVVWENDSVGKDMEQDGRMAWILANDYNEIRWELYKRGEKLIGVVPWKPYPIEGGSGGKTRMVPRVPPIFSGTIKSYYDPAKGKHVYFWIWRNRPGYEMSHDPEMRFEVFHPPDEMGNLTSPAIAALRDWKMCKLAYESSQRIMHQASRMPVFIKHTPPKLAAGDERLQHGFADDEELDMQRERHNVSLEKNLMSRNAMDAAIEEARSMNMQRDGLGGARARFKHSPIINSESMMEIEKREGESVLDRLYHLEAHFEAQNITAPTLTVDPLLYASRSDQTAAAVVDFPMSMVIEQHAQHTGNFDAQITFCRDRLKESSIKVNTSLKRIFLDVERDYFRSRFQGNVEALITKHGRMPLTNDQMREMWDDMRGFEIDQKCTPLASIEQIQTLFDNGFVNPRVAAERMCHILGVPVGDIEIADVKRPIELETERFELEKKVAEETIKVNRESVKQNAEVVKQKGEIEHEKIDLARETAEKQAAADKKKPASGGASGGAAKKKAKK